MRIMMISAAALAMTAMPAMAQNYGGRDDGPRDRQHASRGEVERSRDRVQDERQDLRQAQRYGNKWDVKEQRRDVKQAEREFRQDRQDLRRADGAHWQNGNRYAWNRPDPRYNGYYANNYYRAGNYRPYQLRSNDRIYRGSDNRYYCRRSDGTTGLIVGAIGGGVLGNAIAPGGSKTIGSILGGSLGAILGKSIDGSNVTCR